MVSKVFVLLCVLLLIGPSLGQVSVPAAFRSAGIVDDVIDVAPADLIRIMYGNLSVNLGNELTPTQVRNEPTSILWPVANSLNYYTLIMTDPDVPSRTNRSLAEVKHWLVGNIRGNDLTTGDPIAAYIGAAPTNGTFEHRYVFLVYQQPMGFIDYSAEPRSSNRSTEFRLNFSTRAFAQKYSLGDPTAGNFFLAQYDQSVDEIRREWGL